jgi:O-antigen/teichoic acid export membrane protein
MIGTAFGRVFLAEAPEAYRANNLDVLVTQLHKRLSMIAAPVAVFLVLFGPGLFAFVFGEEWRQSGQYAQWLALALYASFNTAPLSSILAVVEKQKVGLVMQFVLVFLRLAPLTVGIAVAGLDWGIACFSIGSLVGYGLYALVVFKVAGVRVSDVLKRLCADLLTSLFCFGPAAIALYGYDSPLIIFALGMVTLTLLAVYFKRMHKI